MIFANFWNRNKPIFNGYIWVRLDRKFSIYITQCDDYLTQFWNSKTNKMRVSRNCVNTEVFFSRTSSTPPPPKLSANKLSFRGSSKIVLIRTGLAQSSKKSKLIIYCRNSSSWPFPRELKLESKLVSQKWIDKWELVFSNSNLLSYSKHVTHFKSDSRFVSLKTTQLQLIIWFIQLFPLFTFFFFFFLPNRIEEVKNTVHKKSVNISSLKSSKRKISFNEIQ